MTWSDGITGTALQIAATTESPLRVMAGPGTGKSFAMKRRVARLLEENVNPRSILAVTFTRNAAASLVDDLVALGVAGCDEIRAGTLHAFCLRLLGQQEVFEFLGRVARFVTTFQSHAVLQFEGGTMLDDLKTEGEFGTKRDCTRRILAFEAAWARRQMDLTGSPTDQLDREFQEALINWLIFHEAMLIGELVPQALEFLRNNPGCPACSAYDHVIVDEYQDLNKAEQDLIDLLVGTGSAAVVGDVDQSIYSFRHAHPDGIETFDTTHDNTHDEQLDECRRCPTRVVAMANNLIKNNYVHVVGERLRPMAGNPVGLVHTVQWQTLDDEAQGICSYVEYLVHEKGYTPADILIMTPRRLIGYGIRDCIAQAGISAHSFYHEEALESDEAQKALTILSLLANNEDRVALRWWLGEGSPSKRCEAYRRLRSHCEATGVSPWTALTEMENGSLTIPRTADLLRKFGELRTILQSLEHEELSVIIDSVLRVGEDGCAVLRGAALLALGESDGLDDLLSAIQGSVTQPEVPRDVDFVRIMSLQKSKGLTSKVAIVAGCLQGLIPTQDLEAPLEEQRRTLSEQRRLFYVAITRCTEILVISCPLRVQRPLAYKLGARVGQGRGDMVNLIASQFIGELGPQAPRPQRGESWAATNYGY